MFIKIFALHLKSCPMTYCMSIIPKKKILVPMTTKNKGPCLLCFCLVLSLLTFDFEHCSLKALSQPVSFLQSVHGVLKLIASPWDRKEIFNKKCIIPSNFFLQKKMSRRPKSFYGSPAACYCVSSTWRLTVLLLSIYGPLMAC